MVHVRLRSQRGGRIVADRGNTGDACGPARVRGKRRGGRFDLARLPSDLEKYIHREDDLPPLVRTALVHVQFETIHPYLDGNGRIGRLLITLLLEQWKLLSQPLLYLSLYFKQHRAEYYRLLNVVRLEGAWEAWVAFFLEGVSTIADEAATTARRVS